MRRAVVHGLDHGVQFGPVVGVDAPVGLEHVVRDDGCEDPARPGVDGIAYRGTWNTAANPAFLGGQASTSGIRQSSATLKFRGAAVSWVGPMGPTRGSASVYVDGKLDREEEDGNFDGYFELTTFYENGAAVRSEADMNKDTKRDVLIDYKDGKKTRQREDRNYDGQPDVVTLFDANEQLGGRSSGYPDAHRFQEFTPGK